MCIKGRALPWAMEEIGLSARIITLDTPSTIYVYRYPFTPISLNTLKNGLKSPVCLDLSQLWTKNATFLKLFRQNSCTVRLFVIPLHPLSRTNETSSKTRFSSVREAKRKLVQVERNEARFNCRGAAKLMKRVLWKDLHKQTSSTRSKSYIIYNV